MQAPAIQKTIDGLDTKKNAMSGWTFSVQDIDDARNGLRLLNPSIDLSNTCNLNCPYCFVEQPNFERKLRLSNELQSNEILDIVSTLAASGARSVNIVGAGEPTIDPIFENVVTKIAILGMTPVVFTNGIRLSERPKLVDCLYEIGATVVVKYNSASNLTQDLVCGRRGYSRLRNRAIEALIDRGFSSHQPTRLAIDLIVFRGVIAEIPEIIRWCRRLNIFPIVADIIPSGRTSDGNFAGHAALQTIHPDFRSNIVDILQPPTEEQRLSLYSCIKKLDEHEFGIKHMARPAYYTGAPCMQALGLYIDISGCVWPCVARSRLTKEGIQPALLGNIKDGVNISDIWANHPWMLTRRSEFDGSCPFKRGLYWFPDTGGSK